MNHDPERIDTELGIILNDYNTPQQLEALKQKFKDWARQIAIYQNPGLPVALRHEVGSDPTELPHPSCAACLRHLGPN